MSAAEQAKADELRRTYGVGMLTREQIGQELGLRHTATGNWVKDVPHVDVNDRPKYQVSDVARKIIANLVEP
jgi:hypothetical protein